MQLQPKKLRVLCLHSWRTSADIFIAQWRRAGLDVALADLLELVFITAPNPASGPIPEDVAGTFEGPYYEWFSTEKAQDGQELVFTYHNMLKSEAVIMQAIRDHGPFDGICGFSQGGAMASIMVALQAAGMALQDVPPLKFALFFGSVLTTHPRYMSAFKDRVPVPSCHIIGHKDYVKEHAIRLAKAFEAPIVIMHTRGHIVPPLANPHLAALRAFLTSIRDEGCPEAFRSKQRQQQQAHAAAAADPLDPPLPLWETEAEQVAKLQQQKQQRIQQRIRQYQQQKPPGAASSSGVQQPEQQGQEGQYIQVLKIDGQVGRVPQLAPKL